MELLKELLKTEKETITEANVNTTSKPGPNLSTIVWKKGFGSDEHTAIFNFSSFRLERDFLAKTAPTDISRGQTSEERNKWEEKQAVALSKKATPIVRKFISDLQKALKSVK